MWTFSADYYSVILGHYGVVLLAYWWLRNGWKQLQIVWTRTVEKQSNDNRKAAVVCPKIAGWLTARYFSIWDIIVFFFVTLHEPKTKQFLRTRTEMIRNSSYNKKCFKKIAPVRTNIISRHIFYSSCFVFFLFGWKWVLWLMRYMLLHLTNNSFPFFP